MQLLKLQDDGYRHINAVEACRSSWPQARVSSIERRFVKWMMLAAHFMKGLPLSAEICQQLHPATVSDFWLTDSSLSKAFKDTWVSESAVVATHSPGRIQFLSGAAEVVVKL